MNDMLKTLKQGLNTSSTEYQEILEQIKPLEQKREFLEQEIEAFEKLISLKEKPTGYIVKPEESATGSSLADKNAVEAYKELAKNYFGDSGFKEKDIRELASKEGLRVQNELMTGSYSRALIAKLFEKDFLERIGKGLYRYKKY